MSHEPLALKYRPRRFADLVGQDVVSETLKNALTQDRVANAFLFSGSRGTGKTSTARILAKALQCPESKGGEPCAECDICKAIARGDDMDVLEIDGASNRGIDEIRQIRDNAAYAPARARFKVYIIDEVHMLTIQAFNALLKTLEEPPRHVKFIFATTESAAVPETITSRCQRFDFRRIPGAAIVQRLKDIAAREGISVEEEALAVIAHRSEGGLRDALSLLDQCIAGGGGVITLEGVRTNLGLSGRDLAAPIVEALCKRDKRALLDGLDLAFERGRDAEVLLDDLVELLRAAMVAMARDQSRVEAGPSTELANRFLETLPLQQVLLGMRLLLNARREMKLAGFPRVQLELALLKMILSRELVSAEELKSLLAAGGGVSPAQGAAEAPPRWQPPATLRKDSQPAAPLAQRAAPVAAPSRAESIVAPPPPARPSFQSAPSHAPSPARAVPAASAGSAPTVTAPVVAPTVSVESLDLPKLVLGWPKFMTLLGQQNRMLGGFLVNSEPLAVQGGVLKLRIQTAHALKTLGEPERRRQLEQSLLSVFGAALRVECVAAPAPEAGSENTPSVAPERHPGVMKLTATFNGTVVNVSNQNPAEERT